MRRAAIVVVAVTFFGAACTGSSREVSPGDPSSSDPAITDSEPAPPQATEPGTTDPPGPTAAVPDGEAIIDGIANSLVLVHARDDGADTLVSYRADGTKVTSYSTGSDDVIRQPIWSPDGRRVAWATSTDGLAWELVTSAVDGGDRTTHPLPARPDYLTYDPTASRVLALTPSPEGFGLVIVDVGATSADTPFDVVDLGRPYFSDFSPEGDRVIAHVGSDMRIVGLDGDLQSLESASVGHQTPAWHPSEEIVFYTKPSSAGNQLLSYRLATGDTSELATFGGFIFFDIDPTGGRLAVSAFDVGEGGGGGTLDALRAAPNQPAPTTLDGGLWIIDLRDGTTDQVDDLPAAAPMWDPTGSRFLVRSTIAGSGRWSVYELDGTRTATADYDIGSSLMPTYLPFWDQYVRSQTLWSPDGLQFVHVGRAESGRSGVWIRDATTSDPSRFLIEGDLAFWSPT